MMSKASWRWMAVEAVLALDGTVSRCGGAVLHAEVSETVRSKREPDVAGYGKRSAVSADSVTRVLDVYPVNRQEGGLVATPNDQPLRLTQYRVGCRHDNGNLIVELSCENGQVLSIELSPVVAQELCEAIQQGLLESDRGEGTREH